MSAATTILTAIDRQLSVLETKPHKSYVNARARLDPLVALKRQESVIPARPLASAVAAALLAGRDPLTDPEVSSAHLAAGINGTVGALRQELEIQTLDLLRDHHGAILTALTPAFDRAAAALSEAFRQIGAVDLDDWSAIVKRGGTSAQATLDARAAGATIRDIHDVARSLSHLSVLPSGGTTAAAIADPTIDPAPWAGRQLEKATAWDLTRAGITLTLVQSAEEMSARTAAIAREDRRIQGDYEAARTREQKRADVVRFGDPGLRTGA